MLKNILVDISMLIIMMTLTSPSLAPAAEFGLLGFPYNTWGDLSHSETDGLKFETRFEQGIDILKFENGRLHLTPFVALKVTLSDRENEYWNNKVEQDFGIKLRYDVPVSEGHWGRLAIGVRGEQYNYLRGTNPQFGGENFQTVFFFQYGFGGDWKRRK